MTHPMPTYRFRVKLRRLIIQKRVPLPLWNALVCGVVALIEQEQYDQAQEIYNVLCQFSSPLNNELTNRPFKDVLL